MGPHCSLVDPDHLFFWQFIYSLRLQTKTFGLVDLSVIWLDNQVDYFHPYYFIGLVYL